MKTMMMGLCAVVLASGCGGAGSVQFTTWGEAYIEDKIPVDSMETTGFVDGWELKYARFVVVLSEVTLAKKTGEAGPKQTEAKVVDLVKKGPTDLLSFADVPSGKWDLLSYAILPATSTAASAGAIDAADVERMRTGGLSMFVEGSATKGATTKHFAWPLALNTEYQECTNDDFGEGVTVPNGAQEVVQLTIHGDHFWYDDLQSPDAKLRFDAIASADANGDGEVTLDELAAVQLTALPLGQYGTGSAANVKTLKDFVFSLSRTVGHYRGEGHCHSHAR